MSDIAKRKRISEMTNSELDNYATAAPAAALEYVAEPFTPACCTKCKKHKDNDQPEE